MQRRGGWEKECQRSAVESTWRSVGGGRGRQQRRDRPRGSRALRIPAAFVDLWRDVGWARSAGEDSHNLKILTYQIQYFSFLVMVLEFVSET